MKTFLQLIRIKHWIKNLFIFAPLFFSLSLLNYILFIKSLIAFFCFSFVSVLVYILNDIKDKDSDAKHSIKILRPIASGKIKPLTALLIGITFAFIGFSVSIDEIAAEAVFGAIWEYPKLFYTKNFDSIGISKFPGQFYNNNYNILFNHEYFLFFFLQTYRNT